MMTKTGHNTVQQGNQFTELEGVTAWQNFHSCFKVCGKKEPKGV